MDSVWFEINLAIPIEMSASLEEDIIAAVHPRWRIHAVEMRRLKNGVFSLRLTFDSASSPSFSSDSDTDSLREFRDLVVSLIGFSAWRRLNSEAKASSISPLQTVSASKRRLAQ